MGCLLCHTCLLGLTPRALYPAFGREKNQEANVSRVGLRPGTVEQACKSPAPPFFTEQWRVCSTVAPRRHGGCVTPTNLGLLQRFLFPFMSSLPSLVFWDHIANEGLTLLSLAWGLLLGNPN